MATPIINSQMDAINESFSKISSDLTTIRPLLKNASIGAYPTDSASGSIASFTDGAEDVPVKELTVNLEPVQNLNGQSSPYPAGGGKNKLNLNASTQTSNGVTFTVNADKTISTSGTATGTAVFRYYLTYADLPQGSDLILNGCPENGNWQSKYGMALCNSSGSVIQSERVDIGAGTTYSVASLQSLAQLQIVVRSGQNMNGLIFKPMIRLASVTDGTFAPYENVCPISGHTEVNVYRTGKNLYSRENGAYNVPIYATDGSSASYPDVNAVWIPVKPNTLYTIASAGTESAAFYVRWISCTSNKGFISRGGTLAPNNFPYTVRTPANCYWVEVAINQYDASRISRNDWEISVVEGNSTSYEPYAGQTYNVPLGQTVYGGTLNVTTGVLTVDRAMMEVTSASSIAKDADSKGYHRFYLQNDNIKKLPRYTESLIANACGTVPNYAVFEGYSGTIAVTGYHITSSPYNYLYLISNSISTVADMKTWLETTPLQVVYPLATPQTYQLTPTQVSTLLGQNNIFSDSGDVDVVYRADVGLYIDKKLAQALNA